MMESSKGNIINELAQEIAEREKELADILIKSFYYSKGDLIAQLNFWEEAARESGIHIPDYSPSDLMANEHIHNELIKALAQKHKGKHVENNDPATTIKNQLIKALATGRAEGRILD